MTNIMERRVRSPLATTRAKIVSIFAVVAALLIGVGFVSVTTPASAVSAGTVVNGAGWTGSGYGHLGNYTVGGVYVYCIEMGIANDPIGHWYGASSNAGSGYVIRSKNIASGNYYTNTMTDSSARKINYLVTAFGQTSDRHEAAAVQYAVWAAANPTVFGQSHNGWSAMNYYITRANGISWAQRNAIMARANYLISLPTPPAPSPTTSGSATLDINMINGYDGNVVVTTTPANATGTLTLSGAVVTATGATTATVTNGSVIAITGQPIDFSTDKYEINASANFTATVGGGYSSLVGIQSSGSNQKIVSPGPPGTSTISFSATALSADPVIEFQPVVSTEAPQFVEAGTEFSDTLYAGINDPTNPASTAWLQMGDGSYLNIKATGTLYGPFTERPERSSTIPTDAPVAASGIEVNLAGPGTYTTPSMTELTATESGFYTWVWEIDINDQGVLGQMMLPADYYFVDDFGQIAETSIVPINISGTTAVVQDSSGIFQEVQDTVTVSLSDGEWITDNGVNIPVTLTGRAYFQPGDDVPELSVTPPSSATLLDTVSITTNEVGTVTSPSVTVPGEDGWVVWQWSIENSAQPSAYQGYFRDWSDQYGIAEEMTRVAEPVVTTQAMPENAVTDEVSDTAFITGVVPDNTSIIFEAYRSVVADEAKVDGNGNVVLDVDGNPILWTQAEIDTLGVDATCDIQPVFTTAADPITVPAGTHDGLAIVSAPAQFPVVGTYYWVETLLAENPITGFTDVIHRGECGIPNETSHVSIADVITQATADVVLGSVAYDTAIVNGMVPTGATLTFEAFREVVAGDVKEIVAEPLVDLNGDPVLDINGDPVTADVEVLWTQAEIDALEGQDAAVCSPATSVFSSADAPVDVTPGINVKFEYQSPSTVFSDIGTYYWVERLYDRDGNILHEGECGIPSEITTVRDKIVGGVPGYPELAATGSDDVSIALTIGGASFAALLIGAVVILGRRKWGVVSSN